MQAKKISRHQIRARSPGGPPKLQQATLFCPHTCLMITGVRASTPRSKIEKRARMHVSACQSVDSLRAKTAVRLEMETKSLRSKLINKLSLCLVPCIFPGRRPRTSMVKMTYSSCDMGQLCPVTSSSLVLPHSLPPSPTVVAVVRGAKKLSCGGPGLDGSRNACKW